MKVNQFLRDLPNKVNAAAIMDHNTCFHFDIEGEDAGQITIEIIEGQMSVSDGLISEPKCVVKAKSQHLASILSGEMNPMTAVFTGKLKISNPGEMMKYAKIFGLM